MENTQKQTQQLDPVAEFILNRMQDPEYIESEEHPLDNISKEMQIKILEYCSEHPEVFISILRVQAPEGYVPIIPYEKQKEIIKTVIEFHYLILLGSRQTGKTTIIQGLIIWLLVFFDNYKVGILMQRDKSVKDFIREIGKLYEGLPKWIKALVPMVVDSAYKKQLANGSQIEGQVVDPKNPDAVGRGLRVDFLVIDEAAFIDNIDKAYTALKPATSRRHLRLKKAGLPYGTVLISTPNGTTGVGEWFYNQWVDAVNGRSNFKAIKFHWREVPEYDDEWFKEVTADMKQRDINQEYELKFLGAQNTFFEDDLIEKLQDQSHIFDPIDTIKLVFGEVKLYKPLRKDTVYLIGADSADSGEDFAAIVIYDYFEEEVIGIYYDKDVASIDFVQDVYALMKHIDNSILIFEKNSLGTTSIQMLYQELGATRVFVHNKDKRFKPDAYKYAGISTNSRSRKLMFDSLYKYIKGNYNKIYSQELVYELISLEVKGNGRVEASKNAHDDLVLALCFDLYVQDHHDLQPYLLNFNIKTEAKEHELQNLAMIAELNSDKPSTLSNDNNTPEFNLYDNSGLNTIEQMIIENKQKQEEKSKILDSIFLS